MTEIKIFYFTDHSDGKAFASNINLKDIAVKVFDFKDFTEILSIEDDYPVLVFDMQDSGPDELVRKLSGAGVDDYIKLIIADNSEIEGLFFYKVRLPYTEFIARPVDEGSFALLIGKIILVEQFRESIKRISDESDFRIRVLECLISTEKNEILNGFSGRENFIKILDIEKKMIEEYLKVNEMIHDALISGNNEFYYMKDRIKAEEMLEDFRREELIDAKKIIDAQEALIEFSSMELQDAKKILDAMKNVEELSRLEAIELHKELDRLENEKEILKSRINSLKD